MTACLVAGLLGAATFYSPCIGLNWQTNLTCPLCPNVTIVGDSPTERFIRLTIGGGILNAAFLFFVALFLWGTRTFMKRLLFSRPRT